MVSLRRIHGLIRNKKFKYYTDKTMKILSGVIDFDRVQCVIMIDDGGFRKSQIMNEFGRSVINQFCMEEGDFQEPKRFRIEVIGCKK